MRYITDNPIEKLNELFNLQKIFMEETNVYEHIEKLFVLKKFKIINLLRDFRGDSGDDGGFMILISTKHNQFYLHILKVNYNMELRQHILEEIDFKEDGFRDFVTFDSLEQIEIYLNKFMDDINYCYDFGKTNKRFYGKNIDEFQSINNIWNEQYCNFLMIVYNVYSENKGFSKGNENRYEEKAVRNLTIDNSKFYELKYNVCIKTFELIYSKAKLLEERMKLNNFTNMDLYDITLIQESIKSDFEEPMFNILQDVVMVLQGTYDFFTINKNNSRLSEEKILASKCFKNNQIHDFKENEIYNKDKLLIILMDKYLDMIINNGDL